MRQRLTIAAVLGLLCGLACWWFAPDAGVMDLRWGYEAARDLLSGRDPYRHAPGLHLIPYPLTAALPFLPLVWLPGRVAVALLFGLSCGALAWAAGDS